MKTMLCFCAAGVLLLGTLAANAEVVTEVAVVVNDSVITLGEIQSDLRKFAPALALRHANDEAGYKQEFLKLQDQEVESMIENKLILHEFVTSGYVTNVLDAIINDSIKEIIRTTYYGQRSLLLKSLRESGISYETWWRQQREDWIIRYMKYKHSSNPNKIFISPLQIEQYYQSHTNEFKLEDQVHLRMMVLPKEPGSAAGSSKKLAQEILAKIDSGTPFAEMAAVNSSGSQRAEGGDRGWVDRTIFRPELTEVAFSLKPGEHSGVIEQPEACYLLMVEDVKPAHVMPLSEVRGRIESKLLDNENRRLQQIWINRLKGKSFVFYINYYQ